MENKNNGDNKMSKEQVKNNGLLMKPKARSGLIVKKIQITKPEVSYPD